MSSPNSSTLQKWMPVGIAALVVTITTWPLAAPSGAIVQRKFDAYGSLWLIWRARIEGLSEAEPSHLDTLWYAWLSPWLATTFGEIGAYHIYTLFAVMSAFIAAERTAALGFGVRFPASLIAGFAYGLSPMAGTAVMEGHGGMIGPFLPLLIWAVHAPVSGQPWKWALRVTAAGIGCAFQSGYFAVMAVMVILVWGLARKRPVWRVAVLAALPAIAYFQYFTARGMPILGYQTGEIQAGWLFGMSATDLASLAGMPTFEGVMRGYRRHPLVFTLLILGVILPLARIRTGRSRGGGLVLPTLALIAIVISLGPSPSANSGANFALEIPGWSLMERYPALRLFRFPDRALWVYYLAAGIAGAGTVEWLARGRTGLQTLLVLLLGIEMTTVGMRPLENRTTLAEIPSAYNEVTSEDLLVDLWPAHAPHHAQAMHFRSITCYYQTGHEAALLRPCMPDDVVKDAQRKLGNRLIPLLLAEDVRRTIRLLENTGVSVLAWHPDAFSSDSIRPIRQTLQGAFGTAISTSTDGGEMVEIYRASLEAGAPKHEHATTSLESIDLLDAMTSPPVSRKMPTSLEGIPSNEAIVAVPKEKIPWRLPALALLAASTMFWGGAFWLQILAWLLRLKTAVQKAWWETLEAAAAARLARDTKTQEALAKKQAARKRALEATEEKTRRQAAEKAEKRALVHAEKAARKQERAQAKEASLREGSEAIEAPGHEEIEEPTWQETAADVRVESIQEPLLPEPPESSEAPEEPQPDRPSFIEVFLVPLLLNTWELLYRAWLVLSRPVIVIGGSLLLVIAASWPLLPMIDEIVTSGSADGDLGYTIFAQWWASKTLAGQGAFNACPLVYFPEGQDLTGSVWNLVVLFLTAPFHWVSDPITAYNFSILAITLVNTLAFAALGFRLGGRSGGVIAAVMAASMPFAWVELFDGRPEQGFMAPAALYAISLLRLREGQSGAIVWTGLSMAFAAACYWFMAPLLAVAMLPLLGSKLKEGATWMQLALSAIICLLACGPFLALIMPIILGEGGARSMFDPGNAMFMRITNSVNPIGALLSFTEDEYFQHCIPLAAVAGAIAALRHPPARCWVYTALAGLVLSLGPAFLLAPLDAGSPESPPHLPLPMAFLDILPGFERFWWPYRALTITCVGIAGALASWLGAKQGRQQRLLVVGIGLAILLHGRSLSMTAMETGNPNLPDSPLDPAPAEQFFAKELPTWVTTPHAQGGVLIFPLRDVQNYSHMLTPFHGLPTALGDGVGEPLIRPESFNDRIAKNPLLQSWSKSEEVPRSAMEGLDDLRASGFRWLLWILPDADRFPEERALWRSRAANLDPLLGQPDHEESTLVVWDLSRE